MNFTPLNVTMIAVGIILIYAALKDVDPRDVVRNGLKGKPTVGTPKPPTTPSDPTPPPVDTRPPNYTVASV